MYNIAFGKFHTFFFWRGVDRSVCKTTWFLVGVRRVMAVRSMGRARQEVDAMDTLMFESYRVAR